jgi:hypothetical protein
MKSATWETHRAWCYFHPGIKDYPRVQVSYVRISLKIYTSSICSYLEPGRVKIEFYTVNASFVGG